MHSVQGFRIAVLVILWTACLVSSQQVCSLVIDGDDPLVGEKCNASEFKVEFSCLCSGFNYSAMPQLTGIIQPPPLRQPSYFSWWGVNLNTTDYEACLAVDFLQGPSYNATTNASTISVLIFGSGVHTTVQYVMDYFPLPPRSNSLVESASDPYLVEFYAGWAICSVVGLEAKMVPPITANSTNVLFYWDLPKSCDRMSHDLIIDGRVEVENISGCIDSVYVNLFFSCLRRAAVIRTYFLFPDGTRGPSCLEDSPILHILVTPPPQQPQAVVLNVIALNKIITRWRRPSYVGNCGSQFNYSALIENVDKQSLVSIVSLPWFTNENYYNLALEPYANYSFLIATVSASGSSPYASVPFRGVQGQACTLHVNNDPDDFTSSRIASLCDGLTCVLKSSCIGFNPAYLPQIFMTVTAKFDKFSNASFWEWTLINTDPDTPVTLSCNNSFALPYFDVTTANSSHFESLPPMRNPYFSYSVMYSNPAFKSTSYVNFTAIWIPCQVSHIAVTPHLVVSGDTSVDISWTAPTADPTVCNRLMYQLFQDDNGQPTLLATVNGCSTFVNILLQSRCESYNFSLITNFIHPNGTVLGQCLVNPPVVTTYLRTHPDPPNITSVSAISLNTVIVEWQGPYWGGCQAVGYHIVITDMYNQYDLYDDTILAPCTYLNASDVELRAGGAYELYISAFTIAGYSNNSMAGFTAPGSRPSSPSGGLSAGSLAGIVLGSISGVVLIGLGIWFIPDWYRRRGYTM